MMVEVLLFARLRELCGHRQVRVDLVEGATVEDCFKQLGTRFPGLNDLRNGVLVAINEGYASWSDRLVEGDTVAFIPPVSGG